MFCKRCFVKEQSAEKIVYKTKFWEYGGIGRRNGLIKNIEHLWRNSKVECFQNQGRKINKKLGNSWAYKFWPYIV